MLSKDLEKLNLDQKEAKIYLAILELGETSIQRIVSKSGIKRTTVYDVIDSLKSKGFIGTTRKNNKTFYYAEDPRIIGEQLEEKKRVFNKLLPELLSITNLIDKKPKIKYFEGIEGIKEVYRDTLKYPNQKILAWMSQEIFKYFDEDFLWEYYVPERIKRKISAQAIAIDDKYTRKVKSLDEKQLRETKLIPPNQLEIEVEINLYGNRKIGIMAFKEEIGLIIESEKIFNTLKSIFLFNWHQL